MKRKWKKKLSLIIFTALVILGSRFLNGADSFDLEKELDYAFGDEIFENRDIIQVEGGDLSGERRPDVAVDIGFGEREYWAFTNEHGQLVMVAAREIVLQDEEREAVLPSGRYFEDEARVPGTELKEYDQGHVIADSLGGVSNAYNITPQDSFVNRRGEQARVEKRIRDHGGCTDFVCLISYPDFETQVPDKYRIIYRLNGKIFSSEFKNGN